MVEGLCKYLIWPGNSMQVLEEELENIAGGETPGLRQRSERKWVDRKNKAQISTERLL